MNKPTIVFHPLIEYATMISTAARHDIGIIPTNWPKNNSTSSNTIAWITPATGVRPPLLMFVIVRAIAPVAGMPPKNGTTTFATPCAISSVFELCLSPITPSATIADSRLSIAPNIAIVNAEGKSFCTTVKNDSPSANSIDGRCGAGIPCGKAYRSPIVCTEAIPQDAGAYSFSSHNAKVATMIAARLPGIRFVSFGMKIHTARENRPIASAQPFT